VGLLPAGRYLDFYLKVGGDYYKLTVAGNYYTNQSQNGFRWDAGAGVQARFGRVGVRLEYERLPAGMTNSLEYVSLAVILSTR